MSSEIQPIVRSFTIIEYLASSEGARSLREIASACSLPPSTTHRLLNTLCLLDYVVHESNGHYRLSYKIVGISGNIVFRSNFISIVKPFLDNLSDRLNESVHLVARDGNDIVYVYKVTRAIGSIQMASHIGMKLPMYRCAVGKAILATLDNTEIANIFNSSKVIATSPNTITSFDRLMAEIETTRQLGYAIDNEENEVGVRCIATSLLCRQENIAYAFSVSSLKSRITDVRITEIAECLLEIKKQIEKLFI